jgi:GNAT superfamily N-acetyltransferase
VKPPRVRDAGPADVDAVERIRSAFAEDSGWPAAPLHPVTRAKFAAGALPALRVWLAEDAAGAAVGFASACAMDDLFDGPGAWLSDLYVAPAWRRRGVARALVAAVATWAHADGGGYLAWHTGTANDGAQAFYGALGALTKREHLFMVLNGDALGRLSGADAPSR